MDHSRALGRTLPPALTAFALVMAAAAVAHAVGTGFEAESEALVVKVIRWAQRIGLSLVVLAYIEAGTRFFNSDTNQGARGHMVKVFVGSVIVVGAAGLAEVVKSSFSARI